MFKGFLKRKGSEPCMVGVISYILVPIDGFHGAWLHFLRARVGSVFSTAVCKIQASKRYVESSPLVLKDSHKVKRFTVHSCLLIMRLPSRSRTLK